ncbi:hypothetical protein CEXT_541841 [Caerostris extrusa]|uniref:Uncharacterized protein n=1 Tax=Caerostris extrusa TaxID=172846 RepID=A0AAV4U229_CAEEX|nr:hypothetical protein CEXT_541841 [Caerostris extrusa]
MTRELRNASLEPAYKSDANHSAVCPFDFWGFEHSNGILRLSLFRKLCTSLMPTSINYTRVIAIWRVAQLQYKTWCCFFGIWHHIIY